MKSIALASTMPSNRSSTASRSSTLRAKRPQLLVKTSRRPGSRSRPLRSAASGARRTASMSLTKS
ncbi:MAG: hypothetical protein WDN03_02505 [Rhizomicrobium sp.]